MGGSVDAEFALSQARAFSGLTGMDLAQMVSCKEPWKMGDGFKHVIVLDFGVKRAILKQLVSLGCRLTIVPARTGADAICDLKPDGVLLSNGPGDPAACGYAIETARKLLELDIPLFGICFGHQLLALASGARTVKMRHGHHGANHPACELKTGRVFISSQNHSFMVEENSLPSYLEVTYRSLFDGTILGLERKDRSAFGFQGHPEGSPGPRELQVLFAQFTCLMERSCAKKS